MINKERVAYYSQFISVTAKKTLGKSQDQFRDKLRRSSLRRNCGFCIRKCVNQEAGLVGVTGNFLKVKGSWKISGEIGRFL